MRILSPGADIVANIDTLEANTDGLETLLTLGTSGAPAGQVRTVQGPVADDAAAGTTDPVPVGGVYNSTLPTYTNGDRTQAQFDTSGFLRVQSRGKLITGADGWGNTGGLVDIMSGITDTGSGILRIAPHLFNGTSWDRGTIPNATSRITSAAGTTNATSAKASAGRIHNITGYNAAAAVRYLKIYNKASSPTVGSDTPVLTFALPPGAGFAFDFPKPYYFGTGIAYAMTTGNSDADTGALTAGDVLGLNVVYS